MEIGSREMKEENRRRRVGKGNCNRVNIMGYFFFQAEDGIRDRDG